MKRKFVIVGCSRSAQIKPDFSSLNLFLQPIFSFVVKSLHESTAPKRMLLNAWLTQSSGITLAVLIRLSRSHFSKLLHFLQCSYHTAFSCSHLSNACKSLMQRYSSMKELFAWFFDTNILHRKNVLRF